MKELIAIGASVAGHCQPCLTYHVDQAKRLGVGTDEIKEAVSVGRMVEKGAMAAMKKFAQSVLDTRSESPAQFPQEKGNGSKTLKIYDPAMCCPTGVCGTNFDKGVVGKIPFLHGKIKFFLLFFGQFFGKESTDQLTSSGFHSACQSV
jgi:AhpD family alkylhydroperoxidase